MKFFPFIILLFSLQACTFSHERQLHKIQAPAYLHMSGKIDGKYDITMDLMVYESHCDGYYSYNSTKEPISLYGNQFENDSIQLSLGTEEFRGKYQNGIFQGLWYLYKDNKQTKHLTFALKIDTTDCISMTQYTFHDSILGLPGKSYSPMAHFDCFLLLPSQSMNARVTEMLCNIYAGNKTFAGLKKKIEQEDEKYLNTYKNIVADAERSAQKNLSYMSKKQQEDFLSSSLEDHKSINSSIIYNSKDFLTFRYVNWESSGISRGIGEDALYSYSVKENKLIDIKDVLNFNDTVALKAIITNRLHNMGKDDINFRMPEDQYIISPSKYYITPKGICLWYYAFGYNFYQVFISFKDLGSNVKKQSWME